MNTFNPIAYPLSFSDNPQCDRLECSNLVLLPPEILQNIKQCIRPPLTLSWSRRLKSNHFLQRSQTNNVSFK